MTFKDWFEGTFGYPVTDVSLHDRYTYGLLVDAYGAGVNHTAEEHKKLKHAVEEYKKLKLAIYGGYKVNICHRQHLNKVFVEDFYTKKDGVPITYICTTSRQHENYAKDVFYRETPHPQFGNRYFALFQNFKDSLFIQSADWVEDLTFDMIFADGQWHYSSHRHDMVQTSNGFIDGGRSYTRVGGNPVPKVTDFVVRNGKFVEKLNDPLA